MVAWAVPALLEAAAEPRFAALTAIIDTGTDAMLPYNPRREAWRAAIAIEAPPNRVWALDRLASAEEAEEETYAVAALQGLSRSDRDLNS